MLSASWWLFALYLLLVYAIALLSYMEGPWCGRSGVVPVSGVPSQATALAQMPEERYQSIQQMIDDEDFRFAVLEEGASFLLLKNSDAEQHRSIYSRITESPERSLLVEMSEGVERLRAGEPKLGIVMEGSTAQFVAAGSCGRIYSVGELTRRYFSFGFAKGDI